jgi:hypothetical protein
MSVVSLPRAVPIPRVRFRHAVIAVVGGAAVLRLLALFAYWPAFLGYPDTSFYIAAADQGAAEDPFRPGGYAALLSVLHPVGMAGTVLVQHLLGLATAALLYLTVRRLGGSRRVALFPAAAVALCGSQVMIEHALLSEGPFTFLLAASFYAVVRSLDDGIGWILAGALLLGAAVPVRLVAMGLIPVITIWLLVYAPRRRLLQATAFALTAAAIPFAWHSVNEFTRTGPYNLYGRVGPFADCSKFDPPSGTRLLCPKSPVDKRRSTYAYIFTGGSPAVSYFGHPQGYPEPTPDNVDRIQQFSRAAIVGQPLDYARLVAKDSFRYIAPSWWAPPPGDANQMPEELSQYYTTPGWTGSGLSKAERYYGETELQANGFLLETLRVWERLTRFTGLVFLAILIPALAAPFVLRGRARAGAVLLLASGLTLLLVPAATIFYDYRFAIPALGAMAAAGALGARPLLSRLQEGARPLLARLRSAERGPLVERLRARFARTP